MKAFPDQERIFDSLKRNQAVIANLLARDDKLFADQLKDLSNIRTPNEFRDFLRKLRSGIASKNDSKILTAHKEELRQLYFILVEETCFGDVKELKGLLFEAMKQFRACLPYINEVFLLSRPHLLD